jgi:hypothetical protein
MTLMSSSWPKLWSACAMPSAGWLLMAWVRAKPKSPPSLPRASTTPSVIRVSCSFGHLNAVVLQIEDLRPGEISSDDEREREGEEDYRAPVPTLGKHDWDGCIRRWVLQWESEPSHSNGGLGVGRSALQPKRSLDGHSVKRDAL